MQKMNPLVHHSNRGEVVYVPVYIPNNNSKVNSSIAAYRAPFSLQHPPIELIFSNQSNRPLNFNPNFINNIQSSSTPLVLRLNLNEIKNNSNETQVNGNSPLDLSCKSKEIGSKTHNDQHKAKLVLPISCDQCNISFQNNQVLALHKLNECQRVLANNHEIRINKLPFNNIVHKGTNEFTATQEAFICKICNKSFNNFKIYKLHNCDLKSTDEIKVYFQCKLCLNQPTFKDQDDYISHLNNVHQNETVLVKQASPVPPPISPSSPVPTSSLKKLYICKTCGYRGNTLRGVKQHGKLHISQMEKFDILEAGLDEFDKITIFRTVDEKELKFYKNTEILDDIKQIKNENNDDKKRQTTIHDESDGSSDGLFYQTYCTTCKIQFQQERSFNAHKKFYCKESNYTQISS
jgi:hypothetical protein